MILTAANGWKLAILRFEEKRLIHSRKSSGTNSTAMTSPVRMRRRRQSTTSRPLVKRDRNKRNSFFSSQLPRCRLICRPRKKDNTTKVAYPAFAFDRPALLAKTQRIEVLSRVSINYESFHFIVSKDQGQCHKIPTEVLVLTSLGNFAAG